MTEPEPAMSSAAPLSAPEGSAFSSKRLARGLASGAVGQVITTAQSILLVPLFLRAWGADGYGHWLTLTALLSQLSLLDLGGQSFIGNALGESFAKGKQDEFRQRLHSGLALYLLIAVVALVGVCVFALTPVLHVPADRIILVCVAGAVLIALPSGVLATSYRATGKLVRGTMVGNVCRAFALGAYAVTLATATSQVTYAITFLGVGILTTIVVIVDLRAQTNALNDFHISWAGIREARTLVKGSITFWLIAMSQAFNTQGVLVVIAAKWAPEIVAKFSTHRTASSLVAFATSLLYPPVISELTFLVARGENALLRKVSIGAIRAVTVTAGMLALALWIAAPIVYTLWTGKRLTLEPDLLALLAIQAVLMAMWSATVWPLLASNNHQAVAKWSIANGFLTLGLVAMVVWSGGGLKMVVFTSLAVDIVCGLAAYPTLSARFMQTSVAPLYGAMARALLALLPLVGVGLACLWLVESAPLRLALFTLAGIVLLYPVLRLGLGRDGVSQVWGGVKAVSGMVNR